jgi:hypothetical protein
VTTNELMILLMSLLLSLLLKLLNKQYRRLVLNR